MPNPQYPNALLAEQVRVQGEMLARLTVIVEQDHEDLVDLKESTGVIAKAVARQEERENIKADIKSKIFGVGVPLAASIAGVLAGHFIR